METELRRGGGCSAGQLHYPGERFRPAPARVTGGMCTSTSMTRTPPNSHQCSASQVRTGCARERVPGDAGLVGEALDPRSLTADLLDRPPTCPRARQCLRGANLGVLLEKRGHLAGVLGEGSTALSRADPYQPTPPKTHRSPQLRSGRE